MKQFLKTTAVLAVLLLALTPGFGSGTLYIYFDAACMDRLEYGNPGNPTGEKFIVYQVNTPGGDKISLTLGAENPNPVAQLPAQTLNCGNTIFDLRLVQAINQQTTEVIVVRATGGGRYHITKVAYAGYFSNQSGVLMYQSPRFQFAFDTRMGVIGENIALNKATSIVQFEGRIDNACSGEYIFSMSGLTGGPYSNLVVTPEIGVVEDRSGANSTEAMSNTRRLEKVNDRLTADYLRIVCRGERPVPVASAGDPGSVLVPRSVEVPVAAETVIPIVAAETVTTTTVPAVSDPCGEVSGNGYHIVRKEENLYRISLQYKVNVGQLREWNNLNASNTIYPCQKLRVASFTNTNVPAGYSAESLTPRGVSEALPVWKTYAGAHTVQAGETIASIAMRYGYSEYRFRYLNNLSATDVARIGQTLKTTDCNCPSLADTRTPAPATSASYDTQTTLTPRSPAVADSPWGTTGGRIISTGTLEQATATETELTSNSWRSAVNTNTYNTSSVPAPYGNETYGAGSGQLSSGLSARMNTAYDSTVPASYEDRAVKRATHLVGNDETLFDIARRYNTTTENLRRVNNLNPGEAIIPGQRLYVN
jgi:LysM repeat protein